MENNRAYESTESCQFRDQNNEKPVEFGGKALKLDPKNVDLLKAKQNALNEVIKETKEKLDMEKQAAESAKRNLNLETSHRVNMMRCKQRLLQRQMNSQIWRSRQDRHRPCWEVRCRQQVHRYRK